MGKVIINRTNADGTARQSDENLTGSQRGSYPRERAHIDMSRAVETADSVGVKVSTKTKSAASATPKSTSNKSAKKAQSDSKVEVKSAQKSVEVKHFVEPEVLAEDRKEVVKSLPTKTIKVKNTEPKRLGAGENASKGGEMKSKAPKLKNSAKKSDTIIIKREQNVDPEIALMASRASAMEKTDPALIKVSQNNHRSTSSADRAVDVKLAGGSKSDEPEEELRFSKMKSALIGVGVTLAVAVVGFAGIALFGDKKPMCTVDFESNGGSQIEGTEVVCGRAVEQPDDPEKDGFTFEGWMLNGDDYNFDEMTIDHNATLVAKWKAKDGTEIVTVTFDSDGGSTVQKIELAKGSILNLPNVPTKVGYIFDDWYLEDKPFDVTQKITKDITLKAKWEKRPTSSTNNNSGNSNTNNSNQHKPANQVSSISVQSMTLENGKGTSVNVRVLPSGASYSLVIAGNSNPNVASCTMTSNSIVTCDAKSVGSTSVRVRDTNSGKFAQFTVTVTAAPKPPVDDKPDVTDPDDNKDDNNKDEPSVDPNPDNPDPNPNPNPGDDDDNKDDPNGGGGNDNPGGEGGDEPESPGDNGGESSEAGA